MNIETLKAQSTCFASLAWSEALESFPPLELINKGGRGAINFGKAAARHTPGLVSAVIKLMTSPRAHAGYRLVWYILSEVSIISWMLLVLLYTYGMQKVNNIRNDVAAGDTTLYKVVINSYYDKAAAAVGRVKDVIKQVSDPTAAPLSELVCIDEKVSISSDSVESTVTKFAAVDVVEPPKEEGPAAVSLDRGALEERNVRDIRKLAKDYGVPIRMSGSKTVLSKSELIEKIIEKVESNENHD
jgi:hypothetical protein